MKMPFGRHIGHELQELPDTYLDWLNTLELCPPLSDGIQQELERRKYGSEPRLVSFPAIHLKVPRNEALLMKRVIDLGYKALARKLDADGKPKTLKRLDALAQTVKEQLEVRP